MPADADEKRRNADEIDEEEKRQEQSSILLRHAGEQKETVVVEPAHAHAAQPTMAHVRGSVGHGPANGTVVG